MRPILLALGSHPNRIVVEAAGPAHMERLAPVLHYDSDDDLIASVTGQRTEWIAPRVSL